MFIYLKSGLSIERVQLGLGSKNEYDDMKPTSSFNCNDEKLREVFLWIKTQLLIKKDHQHRGTKLFFLAYRLHFIKAYPSIMTKEGGPDWSFHR